MNSQNNQSKNSKDRSQSQNKNSQNNSQNSIHKNQEIPEYSDEHKAQKPENDQY